VLRHPFRAAGNVLRKVILGPLRYRRGGDYDAERYWRDRLGRYGLSLRGAGDEGLSEAENRCLYESALPTLAAVLRRHGVDVAGAAILEVGVGTGFYTGWLARQGATRYLGLDITDRLFGDLRRQYPHYRFVKKDVTGGPLGGPFDLVLAMDVVEHIVTEEKLARAMGHLRACLAPGGVLLVSGLLARRQAGLFYWRGWVSEDVVRHFPGYACEGPIPYRDNHLLVLRAAVAP
jgi:2-polyprenyl-3-methyl-5-hydroxy-6-metoxy-1,4-benzoquinol methylase